MSEQKDRLPWGQSPEDGECEVHYYLMGDGRCNCKSKDTGKHGGMYEFLNKLADHYYQAEKDSGWQDKLNEVLAVLPEEHHEVVTSWYRATQIALIHSEVSEMLEGLRKDTMDSHLPYRKTEEVECADTFIRLFTFAKARGFDLAGAVYEKGEYNVGRFDHSLGERESELGKKW